MSVTLEDGDGGTSGAQVVTVNVQTPAPGSFADTGQMLATGGVIDVVLGDVDGDGDIDMVVAQANAPSRVWLNDGSGNFTDSGQTLADGLRTQAAGLGDLDGDGDLVLASENQSPAQVFFNTNGTFTHSGAAIAAGGEFRDFAFGDVDGDLDLVGTDYSGPGTAEVWLNDGTGVFTDSGQDMGAVYTNGALDLGDLDGDGDGDLDIVLTTHSDSTANNVFLNDGTGTYTATGQALGRADYSDVKLADIDADGNLDMLIVASNAIGDRIFLDDGNAQFTDGGQQLGQGSSSRISVGDIDGDGDIDAIVGTDSNAFGNHPDRVYLNDGTGNHTESLQQYDLTSGGSVYRLELADLDVDGDLDLAVGYYSGGGARVFLNDTSGDDHIVGTDADETITGGAGDDTLEGSGGNDWLDGGDDNDTLMAATATTR